MTSSQNSGDAPEPHVGQARGPRRDGPGLLHEPTGHAPERSPEAVQRPEPKEQVRHLLREDSSAILARSVASETVERC